MRHLITQEAHNKVMAATRSGVARLPTCSSDQQRGHIYVKGLFDLEGDGIDCENMIIALAEVGAGYLLGKGERCAAQAGMTVEKWDAIVRTRGYGGPDPGPATTIGEKVQAAIKHLRTLGEAGRRHADELAEFFEGIKASGLEMRYPQSTNSTEAQKSK